MADFNQILGPGNVDDGTVNVVVEIPAGSSHKIEWNRELAVMQLDRVEPAIFAKPTNYGFIPQTLDEDGDELDALIVTDEPLPTGVFLEAKIVGVMKFEDGGEVDDKIIAVLNDDKRSDHITNYTQLGEYFQKETKYFWENIKALKKPGTGIVKEFAGPQEAIAIIKECSEKYSKEYAHKLD